ncbi:MAG: copper-binding protein [Caulobacteraceae bacterium]
MSKRIVPILIVCLMAATAAHAQYGGGGMGGAAGGMGGGVGGGMGGGGMGGGGGGHRGGRGRPPADPSAPAPERHAAPVRQTPLNKVEIIGVVQAIDPAGGRITIAYEPVDALNWPAGTLPFQVAKTAILKDATVGEKVRFKIESQQISDLEPYIAPPAASGD